MKINDITCINTFLIQPDTSAYSTDAVIADSYFEDAVIEVNGEREILILDNLITYVPDGYVKYETVCIQKRLYIIMKANINGVLYTEWFRFSAGRQSPLYIAGRRAVHGTGLGLKMAFLGISLGIKEAARGIGIGGKHSARGLESGLEGTTEGIGKAIYSESKMFYQPRREFDGMDDFLFDEKTITVEKNVEIYTYFFSCASRPKANIFLVHGNGGNVYTYKNMIRTLLAGGYNVYAVDWRGYGKSGGKPDYKGVLKDTEAAFDDFMSSSRHDSLKIVVYGMSLGGQIATKLVRERQGDVDALVLDGCLSSAQNLALDFMPAGFIRNSMRKNVKSFNQDYIAETDIQKITNIPKLIIQSVTDKTVSFYHAERLYENAREPKFLWKTATRHIRTLEELPDETICKIDQLLFINKFSSIPHEEQ